MKIYFEDQGNRDFFQTLKNRVDDYFLHNKLSKQGGFFLYAKSAAILGVEILLYLLLISNWLSATGYILTYMLFGITTGLLNFMIVHEVLHGGFSPYHRLNKVLGYLFDITGISSYVWKVTHNTLHHTYTNIPGFDADIDKAITLRLNPKDTLRKFHHYQNYYAFFLYSLVTINWVFYADYSLFFKEIRENKAPRSEIILFFILKVVNLFLLVGLPLLLLQLPWWVIILGYFCGHLTSGLFISTVFQLAHVVESTGYAEPNDAGIIKNNWAAHELATTCDFAPDNLWLNWLLGGLNLQVEHHLFPLISHVHYPALQKIVKQTAAEYGLPYNECPTVASALVSHYTKLKELGRSPCTEYCVEE